MTDRILRRQGRQVIGMKVVVHIDPPRCFGMGPTDDEWYNDNANLFSSFVSRADFVAREVKDTATRLWGNEHDVRVEMEYEEEDD